MYVLDYTIIGNGLPYQSSGTDHRDALRRFIADPSFTYGWHSGNYFCEDGEKIAVVGPTQEAWADRERWRSSRELAIGDAARGGKGIRDARRRLMELEARGEPEVEQETIVFTMRARTVYDALTPEEIFWEEQQGPLEDKLLEISQGLANPVRIKVRTERQTPSERVLTGTVQSTEDRGVWINNKLIPWRDIEGFEEYTEVIESLVDTL